MMSARYNSGFTLVEMLVYLAILLLITTAMIASLLLLSDVFTQYRAEQAVFRSATTALERMTYEIARADTVVSATHNGEGVLSLSGPGGAVTFATSSEALIVTASNGSGSLTGEQVAVQSLHFYSYSDVTDVVRVALTLSATVGETSVTRTFKTAVVLRATYE